MRALLQDLKIKKYLKTCFKPKLPSVLPSVPWHLFAGYVGAAHERLELVSSLTYACS